MTFKPYPWLTFFTALVFGALITLGVWQVQRYGWKLELNHSIVSAAKLPPAELTTLLADNPAQNHIYQPVKLSGEFTPNQQILVRGQYKKSVRIIFYGFYVFNPFVFNHDGIEKTIMVERGFITEEAYNNPKSYNQLPTGTVEIHGHVKTSEKPGSFMPPNDTTSANWFWRDIPAMGEYFKLQNTPDLYISLSDNPWQNFPKPSQIEIKSASSHLSYLITWFAMAAALLILYIYMHIYNGRLYLTKNKPNNSEIKT